MVRSFDEQAKISRGAMLKHCPAGLDAYLAEYLAGDIVRDKIDEIDREVNSATSTLRELQRQMAVLRARLSVLNSTENSPSDGAECGGSTSGEDEFDEGYFEQRPGQKLVRCTTVLAWTPLTNTVTLENGCAVLEAGAGGHIAGFTAAMVIV